MTTRDYETLALEELVKDYFKLDADIKKIIIHDIPVSPTLEATVFVTKKNQLYAMIRGKSRATLADIRKIIARMHLKAHIYVPPHGNKSYFNDIAETHFKKVFPGKRPQHESDLVYYKTLAPYLPALVHIKEVVDGVIYQYDTDSATSWRPAVSYSYRRIIAE
jgi:hypothetical protein